MNFKFNKEDIKRDVLASFVVFLVALPLCLGIAAASGIPAYLGVVSGAVGGIIVGLFGGSPLQVSGPANGLIVIIYALVQDYGLGMLGIAVVLAGLIQMLAGLLRLGQLFRAVSPGVIHGLMLGFAVIIFSSQFHVMLGMTSAGGVMANLARIPESIMSVFSSETLGFVAIVGVATYATIVLWRKYSFGWLKAIPASLVAVALGTGLSLIIGAEAQRIAVPENILGAIQFTSFTGIWDKMDIGFIEVVLTIAFIASAETLLSATAVDQMHSGKRTRYSRELAAQGFGNMCCGVLGAPPITGVIIRSSANVNAGAKTQLSTILHGFWLVLFVVALPFVLELVPMACLAAILIDAVIKLVNVNAIKEMKKIDPMNIGIWAATAIVVVSVGVIAGVATGIVLSLLRNFTFLSSMNVNIDEKDDSRVNVTLGGAATFYNLPRLASELESITPQSQVKLQCDKLQFLDHACLDLLRSFENQHTASGGVVDIQWDKLPTTERISEMKKDNFNEISSKSQERRSSAVKA